MIASPGSVSWSTTALHSARLLRELPEKLRPSLLALARRTELPANVQLCTQGEAASQLFLINDGRISYVRLTAEGKQTILFWLRAGDSFGLGTLLMNSHPYMGSAISVSPCQVFSWEHASIRDFALSHPQLACSGIAIALHYLSLLAQRHDDVLNNTARARVAKTLLQLAKRTGSAQSEGIDVQITNEQLASLADVSPFTVSRLLSDWNHRGALKKQRKALRIVAPEELMPYAE